MTLEVIGVGLGRNGTLSLKFALEHLGFGPCCHMTEVFADGRRLIPLWMDAADGNPDWEAIFTGFRSTCDYPSATFWREIADHYPNAKVILTTRDPDRWFDSVSATIFAPWMQNAYLGTPAHDLMRRTIFEPIGGDVSDRAFLTDWYMRRNQAVVDAIAPERLLRFDPRDGWEAICRFLDVPVPEMPYPAVNTREQIGPAPPNRASVHSDPEMREQLVRHYLRAMREAAFAAHAPG